MTICYVALGSNLDSPARQLKQALLNLKTLPKTTLLKAANFYPNQAWGRKAQPPFYNTVAALQTCLNPFDLLNYCQKIENQQGRFRHTKWGARTLDIDILLFGTMKINHPRLTIPHPCMLQRDFVLIPLLQIAPNAAMPNGQLVITIV